MLINHERRCARQRDASLLAAHYRTNNLCGVHGVARRLRADGGEPFEERPPRRVPALS